MLILKHPPPVPSWVFEFRGITFKREGDEQFIYTTADKKADLDPARRGWINRIMQFAAANKYDLTEQEIYQSIQKRIPGSYRKRYFDGGVTREPRQAKKREVYHQAPIPTGLMEAARSALGVAVASDSDEDFLHDLSAREWLLVLGEWKRRDQTPTSPERFGPVWWMCLHVLGITQEDGGYKNVRSWIDAWTSSIPCPMCKRHFGRYSARRPISWAGLKRWASQAHSWVTTNKEK